MKVILCLLALLVAAGAVPIQSEDLGVAVMNFYEKLRETLPCGIAGSGPLDPYVIDKQYTEEPLKFETGDVNVTFHIKALEVSGLSSFKLVSAEYHPDIKEFKAFFILPNLYVKSNFSWSSEVDIDGKMKMSHSDDAFVDAHFKLPQDKLGFSFEFSNDEDTGKLTTKNWKLHGPKIHWDKELSFLGEQHSDIKNEITQMIDEVDKDINDMAIEFIQERFNDIIVSAKDVHHIVEELHKASGDEHTGPFGDKLCVH